MLTLRNFVGLVASLCLICGSPKPYAETAKVVSRSATPKIPKSHAASTAGGGLSLTCGRSGYPGKPFLVATAAGGTAPYTFNVSAPDGVTFNSSNEQKNGSVFVEKSNYIAEETATFDVKVSDSSGSPANAEISCPINIVPMGPGALDVECPGVAYVNTAFNVAVVRGGEPPFIYAASPLPDSLTPDKTTGVIPGASTAGTIENVKITVTDKSNVPVSKMCSIVVKDQPKKNLNCMVFPVLAKECVDYGAAKNVNINNFWGTNGNFVFFNQVKSIYNSASSSQTISADIGTLNFPIGMQLNIGTNVQAGSTPPTPVSTGTIPTLSHTAAAQAAENMLYGGTIYVSGAYPILAIGGNRINSPGNWGGMLDLSAREGVDIQSFKAGTSTSANTPASHTSLQTEGYVQMNSTNLPTVGGGTFAGALFAGGSWGYSYTAHQYIRDYGIKNAVNRLGQWSAGIILNGVAKLAFSKAYGPLQSYYDGTLTPLPTTATTVNNFKAWSFELTYQAPAPK